jgi:outer membrane protein assembly factor BamB
MSPVSWTRWVVCFAALANTGWFLILSQTRGMRTRRREHFPTYVLDASSGAELWRYGPADVAPAPLPVGDNKVIVASADSGGPMVSLLEGRTGRRIWSVDVVGEPAGSPVLSGSNLILRVTTGSGSESTALVAIDTTSGQLRWQFEAGLPILQRPIVDAESVFIATSSQE